MAAQDPRPLWKRPKVIFVNEPSKYTRNFIQEALAKRPEWRVVDKLSEEVTFQWNDYDEVEWEPVFKGQSYINSYCTRKGLIRKAHLAQYVDKYGQKRPDSLLRRSVPRTEVIDYDPRAVEWSLADARSLMEDHPGWYVLKPSITDGAADIIVVDDFAKVRAHVKQLFELRQWVLQQYVAKPLLVFDRKFHLRVYVLAVGSLQVFVCDNVLALIAAEPFTSDLTRRYSHITNTCANSDHQDFKESFNIRLWSELGPQVGEENVQLVFGRVKEVVADLFRAFRTELQAFMPLSNAFELFGLDFIVDSEMMPHLLEVNSGPDFKNTGYRLRHIIRDLIEDTFTIAVDPYFSNTPVPDQPQIGHMHLVYVQEQREWGSSGFHLREDT